MFSNEVCILCKPILAIWVSNEAAKQVQEQPLNTLSLIPSTSFSKRLGGLLVYRLLVEPRKFRGPRYREKSQKWEFLQYVYVTCHP